MIVTTLENRNVFLLLQNIISEYKSISKIVPLPSWSYAVLPSS